MATFTTSESRRARGYCLSLSRLTTDVARQACDRLSAPAGQPVSRLGGKVAREDDSAAGRPWMVVLDGAGVFAGNTEIADAASLERLMTMLVRGLAIAREERGERLASPISEPQVLR